MERGDLVAQFRGRVFVELIFDHDTFVLDLVLLLSLSLDITFHTLTARLAQQRQPMIHRIIDIDVISHNLTLHTKLLPSLLRPNSLTQILTSKMRARGVILAPLTQLLLLRRLEQDILQLIVRQTFGGRPRLGGRGLGPGRVEAAV